MKTAVIPLAEDLAPGDQSSTRFDFSRITLSRIKSTGDPLFKQLYAHLWSEFGNKGEMESQDILDRRLAWKNQTTSLPFHLRYEMLGLMNGSEFVAVRDHSVIIPKDPRGDVIVHLSHALIAPPFRGKGLVGWLRAFPLQLVRLTLQELGQTDKRSVTLVCEMEPLQSEFPDRIVRLKSYAKAGFLMIDPNRVRYLQPDFSAPGEIDKKGGPTPLPLRLILRRVGNESSRNITGAEIKNIVQSLYAMYGACFRDSDMKPVYESLANYPKDHEEIELLSPLTTSKGSVS